MNPIRMLTAGESHGKAEVTIIEGIPAGLPLTDETINRDLARRQVGYGRGARMKIETDKVEILSGVRFGETLGSPICLQIENRDHKKWTEQMSVEKQDASSAKPYEIPRPGHADLAGGLKYNRHDFRDILERASARETAARVAAGAVCRCLLRQYGVQLTSHLIALGGIEADTGELDFERIEGLAEASDLRCVDDNAATRMREKIDRAKQQGDTLGGVFEVLVRGLAPGVGSHVHWDRKLDGKIAQAVMSIQAVKGVEIGLGFRGVDRAGSEFHDQIAYNDSGFRRTSNRAGGTEGGMTSGELLRIRGAMKPISTVMKGLRSVHGRTKEATDTRYERSDVTAVPAAGVVAEGAVAFVLANAYIEKFGGDSVTETIRNYKGYCDQVKNW